MCVDVLQEVENSKSSRDRSPDCDDALAKRNSADLLTLEAMLETKV